MKAIIGADLAGSYRSAAELVCRLGFSDTELDFLNVIEPMPSTGWFAPTGYVPPSWEAELRNAGEAIIEQAIGHYCSKKINSDGRITFGSPADALVSEAEARKADLIAIGSSQKSRWESALLGSVGRALAVSSKKSILLARRTAKAVGPMTAVFATDHSPYAGKVIQKFLHWKPSGIEKIHLVTAMHMETWAKEALVSSLPQVGGDAEGWVHKELSDKSDATAEKFRAAGYTVHTHVLKGHPNDVLHHAMSAFAADILICGGQGHGFMERLVVGSVALHQAVAESYSLLIVRP